MSLRHLRCALAVACLIAVTACTTTTSGSPVPDGEQSTGTSTSSEEDPSGDNGLPSHGAPKVENPLDASHFEQNPCDALTPEQAGALNVGPEGKRADTNFGKGCHWRNTETRGSVIIGFLTVEERGLSSAYRSNERGEFTFFEPLPDVEGLPAVAYDIVEKNPVRQCSVAVGLSDQLIFTTTTSLSTANVGQKDPCEAGAGVAGEIVKTIKEGA